MARSLSNKALSVLALLREDGGEHTCKEIAERIKARTPCGHCDGTGDGDDSHYGCRRCYGRGRAPFYYSDAYVCLQKLMRARLVRRRYLLDEWGDETPSLVYEAVAVDADPADPLEALYLAPSAERPA